MISVFSKNIDGVVKITDDSANRKAYITISDDKLRLILMGTAPVTAVSITQSVDMDAHKALDGNYTLASFGYSLTTIVISGLDIYTDFGSICPKDFGTKYLQGWWDKYNLQAKRSHRLTVSIVHGSSSSVFTCVAIKLDRKLEAMQGGSARVGTYVLTIIGIKK